MSSEATIRLFFFFGVLVIMLIWEVLSPKLVRTQGQWVRSLNNLILVLVNTLLVRIVLVFSAVEVASYAQSESTGLLNHLGYPQGLEVFISVIFLDFIIYGQHFIFHKIPILWRVHRMHHADLDYDVTTGLRFHPIEIILSMLIKFFFILIFGISPLAVVIFEITLNAMAMFNHGNISLPKFIDSTLRPFIVTPDMHRIHHSIINRETHSNYGFNLSLWDRVFKTYIERPSSGEESITIGLPYFRESKYLKLHWLLAIPFLKNKRMK